MVAVCFFALSGQLLVSAEVSPWAYISDFDQLLARRGYRFNKVSYVSLSDWMYSFSSHPSDDYVWQWYPGPWEDFQVVFHCTGVYELPLTVLLGQDPWQLHTIGEPRSRIGVLNSLIAAFRHRIDERRYQIMYRRQHDARLVSAAHDAMYLDSYAAAHDAMYLPRVHVWRIELHLRAYPRL